MDDRGQFAISMNVRRGRIPTPETTNMTPVVVFKFNKDILNYLQGKEVPVIYVEDTHDARNFANDMLAYDLQARYKINDLNSLSDVTLVAAQIKADHPEARIVISTNEYSQYPAAIIREAIDEDTNQLATTLTSYDKGLMKHVLSMYDIPVAKGFPLAGEIESQIAQICARIGFPCIVKPRCGMSSQGVAKICSEEDLDICLTSIKDKSGRLDEYLCEEYIDGEEFFVDAIWSEGAPHVFLLGKYAVPMLEVAHGNGLVISRYFARSEDESLYDEILRISKIAARACKFDSGISHTEFLVDKTGFARLGETATRMGGGPHSELAKCAIGYSLGELQCRTLLNDLGDVACRNDPSRTYGYVNLQPVVSGLIENILSEEELVRFPGVVKITKSLKPGDMFQLRGSSTWCLCCIVQGKDPVDFNSRISDIVEAFNERLVIKVI